MAASLAAAVGDENKHVRNDVQNGINLPEINPAPQVVGSKAFQFRLIGRQAHQQSAQQASQAHTNTNARNKSHRCWKLGNGKTRRY
jgi:hypothetical protein